MCALYVNTRISSGDGVGDGGSALFCIVALHMEQLCSWQIIRRAVAMAMLWGLAAAVRCISQV